MSEWICSLHKFLHKSLHKYFHNLSTNTSTIPSLTLTRFLVAVAYALETGLLPLIVPASRAYLQGDTDGPDVNNEEHTRQDWLTAFESVRDREDKPDEWIELQSMLVDVLCMMDIQLRAGKQEESMQRLVEFVQDLLVG